MVKVRFVFYNKLLFDRKSYQNEEDEDCDLYKEKFPKYSQNCNFLIFDEFFKNRKIEIPTLNLIEKKVIREKLNNRKALVLDYYQNVSYYELLIIHNT